MQQHPSRLVTAAALLACAGASSLAAPSPLDAGVANLVAAFNPATGLFGPSSPYPFWTTANAFETLANYLALPPSSTCALNVSAYEAMLNVSVTQLAGPIGTDAYRDDHLWWILALTRATEVTGNPAWLSAGRGVYGLLVCVWRAWNATCGGMEWEKGDPYLNAITNELFLTATEALIASDGPSSPVCASGPSLSAWSDREWTWFNATPMYQPAQGVFQDGLSQANCSQINPGGSVWSYNQGVWLRGVAQRFTRGVPGADRDLAFAAQVVRAAMKFFACTPDGVACEVSCGAQGACDGQDGQQFKGVFARYLMYAAPAIAKVDPATAGMISSWLANNTASVLSMDSLSLSPRMMQFGQLWQGPYQNSSHPAVAQGAALDLLIANAVVNSQ